jgi:hypothetical protein
MSNDFEVCMLVSALGLSLCCAFAGLVTAFI